MRWDAVRSRYVDPAHACKTLNEIAQLCGVKWFATRDDTLEMYVGLEWASLKARRGFGPGKIKLLMVLLEAGADRLMLPPAIIPDASSESVQAAPMIEHREWNHISPEICNFSTRVLKLAALKKADSLRKLWLLYDLEWPEKLRENNNAGKVTVEEIGRFYQAWSCGDLDALSKIIPLDSNWNFSLELAVGNRFYLLPDLRKAMLFRRLADHAVLATVGRELGVSIELVRRVEQIFISHVGKCLKCFPARTNELFAAWKAHQKLPIAGTLDLVAKRIIHGAVERCFLSANTPETLTEFEDIPTTDQF